MTTAGASSPFRCGTYSIVARDSETGELGVAVQSHWFSVGPVVPWARPGVGAVATQAMAQITYGPRALELLEQGVGAAAALERLLEEDPAAETRQVAIVDAQGTVATHTGRSCIPFAGHSAGEGVSCQANIMASETVWPAMLEAYERTPGLLRDRLLAALEAAEAEGGDIRGRQSAAILIVPGEGESWRESLSLRVEDHPEPLEELQRLVRIDEAYALASRGDALIAQQRYDEAGALFQKAGELAPGQHELRFWSALGFAQAGDMETATARMREAIEAQPGWLELLPRMPAEIAPAAASLLESLRLTSPSG